MKRCWILGMLIVTLWACKPEEDPGPDLSGSISFTWEKDNDLTSYYVVISDTSGNVLSWKKLLDYTKETLPYPPGDSKLANVTLIKAVTYPTGDHLTELNTYTGVVGADYVKANILPLPRVHEGELNVTIANRSNYNVMTVFVKDGIYLGYQDGQDFAVSYGLVNNGGPGSGNNLLVLLQNINPLDYRYLYTPNVAAGEISIKPEDLTSMNETPAHALNYPDHATKMDWSVCIINGLGFRTSSLLEFVQWEHVQAPIARYPVISGLFIEYETIVIGFGNQGESYITDVTATDITTNIVNLQTEVKKRESFTTERISADLSGEGDALFISDTFGPSDNSVQWNIYTPMTTKLRLNPPRFPDDLIRQIPALEETKEGVFNDLSFDDYNVTYDDFYNARLNGDSDYKPKEFRSTYWSLDNLDAGRKVVDPRETLKRYGITMPR